MANRNLKDQRISSTYQRLVQLHPDTSTICDGSGSYITKLDISGEVSASGAISGSYVYTPTLGGITLDKKVEASDVASSAGALTSNYSSLSHTLTLDGTTADDAEHADVTITSDKVKATSTVIGCASLKVDVVVHTVVAGSFKFYFVNKSGGTLANDSTVIFNFVIL